MFDEPLSLRVKRDLNVLEQLGQTADCFSHRNVITEISSHSQADTGPFLSRRSGFERQSALFSVKPSPSPHRGTTYSHTENTHRRWNAGLKLCSKKNKN